MIPEARISADAAPMSMVDLKKMLKCNGLKLINEVKVTEVTEEGVILTDVNISEVTTIQCDTVALSPGMRKNTVFVYSFKGINPETYVIGDCSPVGGILWKTVRSGFDMGREL